MKTFVTFGRGHGHIVNGQIINKQCVAVVNGDMAKVFEIFGTKFCYAYREEEWSDEKMKYFPGGYIDV